MKKILTLTAAALISASCATYAGWGSSTKSTTATTTAAASSATNIGVVDYMEVFKDVPQGQGKLDSLKSDLKPKVAKLKASQDALQKQIETLEKNAPTMSKGQRDSKEADLNKQQQAFQDQVMQLRESEIQKEQAAAKVFETDMNKAITQVAESGHYQMILTKQAVPYVKSDLDVTNQVIANMKKLS